MVLDLLPDLQLTLRTTMPSSENLGMSEPHWKREIIELHDVFESYFLGTSDELSRVEAVLADDFTFIGPDAGSMDRSGTLAAIAAGHGHTESLTVRTVDHQLIFESDAVTVAEYIEEHVLADRTNRRLSTVIFSKAPDAPNALVWRRVHETWIDQGLD